VGAGASCSVSVAFKPTLAGARGATLTVNSTGIGSPQTFAVSGTGQAAVTPGQLSVPGAVAFGTQNVGSPSGQNVTVTNIGGSAVTFSSVSSNNPSEFAISSNSCAGTVGAGMSCGFTVTFIPAAAGSRGATVTVISTGTGSPQSISVNGTGTSGSSNPTVTVVEYRNSEFDHYFITPVAAEISLLDSHAPPFQAWSRTGLSFNGYVNATAPATSVAICRFFNSTFAPKSSHFYAPHGLGCEATGASFPDWKLEDDRLFNSTLPDANGACPAGTVTVYRLYNAGMGGAPNHRYVTMSVVRDQMLANGWILEGNMPGLAFMCSPP
jgi:hypothetical protein